MNHTCRYLLSAVLLVSPPAAVPASADAPRFAAMNNQDSDEWRDDLRLLAESLASKHKDAFSRVSREQFDAAVADLDERLPQLTDRQAYLEFRRLVAMVGDAHTMIADSKGRFAAPYYPFSVMLLGDGVFITAATEAQQSLLGLRITRVSTTAIDDAIARLGAIISHENDAWLRNQARMWLMSPDALAFVGVVDDPHNAMFTLAGADGRESVVRLAPMATTERQSPSPLLTADKLAPTLRPRPNRAIYGSMMLPDSHDLYIWYDSCSNAKDRTVAQFATETLALVDRDTPERIIIDLRRNGGGNSALIGPLVRGLASREATSILVLIGSNTFSSGLWAAEDLKRHAHAVLVGTPTGGKPNSFGEQRSVELPHSGLTLYYSTKKWIRNPEGDPDSLEPDVLVDMTYADLIAGRDAALDAAQAYKAD